MNIVHVNQHVIKHNAKHGSKYPTLTVKLDAATQRAMNAASGTVYCHEVSGTGRVVDSNAQGRSPLSCGARVWMEFDAEGFAVEGSWMDYPTLRVMLDAKAEYLTTDEQVRADVRALGEALAAA